MWIKILRNLGAGLPDYKEGQVVDAEDKLAGELLRRRLAEHAEAKASKPPKPAPKAEPAPLADKPEPEAAKPSFFKPADKPAETSSDDKPRKGKS